MSLAHLEGSQLHFCCEDPSSAMGFAQCSGSKYKDAAGGEMVKKKKKKRRKKKKALQTC